MLFWVWASWPPPLDDLSSIRLAEWPPSSLCSPRSATPRRLASGRDGPKVRQIRTTAPVWLAADTAPEDEQVRRIDSGPSRSLSLLPLRADPDGSRALTPGVLLS